ncbi:MAG TPA: M50 family metallopeptidase [Candidatus Saccharimonadales bacterium]|nr:M50 family metallopeptidase [Candidatus Saccharimonadales bacterium]
MAIFLLIVGLIMFVGLVVVHEWGHFIMARRNGVEVEEFSIFFPPRLYSKKTKAGWNFSIGLLPLGGFVKMKGEHDTDTAKGSFGAASLAAKSKIMAAGVVMNLIAAFALFTILGWIGMPHLPLPNNQQQFTIASDTTYISRAKTVVHADTVEKNSPAAHAGIKSDDELLAIGNQGKLEPINTADELPRLTYKYAGQTVQIRFEHQSKTKQKSITLNSPEAVAAAKKQGKPIGYLGVTAYEQQKGLTVSRSTWSAPIVAFGVMKQFTVLTFQGLGTALKGLGGTIAGAVTGNTQARQEAQTEASSQVSGPVGIFFVFKYGAELGYKFILFVVAIISLTLAIMNILPIPALDGGRLWITLFSRLVVKRPLSPEREEMVNASGFAVLMALIILITVVDVKRFF